MCVLYLQGRMLALNAEGGGQIETSCHQREENQACQPT